MPQNHRPARLTRRGEVALATLALLVFLLILGLAGGIEQGTL